MKKIISLILVLAMVMGAEMILSTSVYAKDSAYETLEGVLYKDGDPIVEGTYHFDENGVMGSKLD